MKEKIQSALVNLEPQLKRVSKLIQDAENDGIYNSENPEEMYLRGMFYQIQGKLNDARRLIRFTVAPVLKEGVLHKRSDGRYGLQDGTYFTSGGSIEYLLTEPGGGARWVSSRVEHDGEDYCIVGRKGLSLQGLRVRVKEIPLWD